MLPSVTVYVPARLNSERLPEKAKMNFCGKPLVSVILETLKKSKFVSKFYLNTDSLELKTLAEAIDIETYIRSEGLVKSDTTTEEILLDFVKNTNCNTEYVAAINPTNPLLSADTIDKFIELVKKNSYDTAFSVSTIKKHCLMSGVPINYSPFGPHPRTQDVKEVKILNWAIVMWRTNMVKERILRKGDSIYLGKVGFIDIPEEESTDIDTKSDFEFAVQLFHFKNKTMF